MIKTVLDFIKRQIVRYRDLLSNVSRRNKELYYRESRGHSVNLSKPPKVDSEFHDIIFEKYLPLRTSSPKFQTIIKDLRFNISDHFLLDETNNINLIKRLDKIRLADEKFQREFGISGAWLLGPFLCWRDSINYKQEDLLISPLFKIAVDVKKDRKKKWSLELHDNTLQPNPSLRIALRQKWGIDLPEQFESEQIIETIDEFKTILENSGKSLHIDTTSIDSIPKISPRFKIIKDESGEIIEKKPIILEDVLTKKELDIYNKVSNNAFYLIDVILLDHLNLSRTVLLRDYDKILEDQEMHPILSELFLGKPIPREKGDSFEQLKKLDEYKERENYFVINIDSSQHSAIEQTKNNKVVVIQGPPGTGKSQTITNLIADSLAKGKKTLFVSEKRAALDVVHSRLQQANLASQTVLIHSSDLNKQHLYNSFLELSDSAHDIDVDNKWNSISDELDNQKLNINNYYKIIESKHIPSEITISELLTLSAQHPIADFNVELAMKFTSLSFYDLQKVCSSLDDLKSLADKIPNFPEHPWLHKKKNTIYTLSLSQQISNITNQIRDNEFKINNLIKAALELNIGNNLFNIPLELLDRLIQTNFQPLWYKFANYFFQNPNEFSTYHIEINKILEVVNNEIVHHNKIKGIVDFEIIKQMESYYSTKRRLMDFITPIYWKLRNLRRQYVTDWDGTNIVFRSYRLIFEKIQFFNEIPQNKLLPIAIDESNPKTLLDTFQCILEIAKISSEIGQVVTHINLLEQNQFPELSEAVHEKINEFLMKIRNIKGSLHDITRNSENLKEELDKYFDKPPNYKSKSDFDYNILSQTIHDINLIDHFDIYLDKINSTQKIDISKEFIIDYLVSISSPWGAYVLSNVIKWWLDEIHSNHPKLRTFDRETFNKDIETFKDFENQHRNLAQEFVNNTFSQRWNKGVGEFEGLSLLKKESNKQRKVLPPREIMEKGALSTMMKLKPCWLMSPLSISQILPNQMGLFDIVIFDEASQVRVEDAVPSIYRANFMVVVGDPKQMPPTNFFANSSSEDDSNEDEDNDELTVSILDLASQIYPSEMLEWHYRSRSESLISFSNRAFYGGRLISTPNPSVLTEGDTFKFNQINEAYFNYKDGNLKEAQALVERLAILLKKNSNKSIGIIAMGQSQMLAIEDEIERRQLEDSTFRRAVESASNYFDGEADASLFVKNLENVQGDERDIILISIGYAPSNPSKKLSLNFGPLSKQGGSRRLNVAITRAKYNIEVFCSFDPNQIPTDETNFSKNPDLVLFGRYLKYVQAMSNKEEFIAKSILDSFGIGAAITTRKSSSFNKDVKRRLEDLGYIVSAEIGSNGFYLDLGVHHPVIPSNFILGIECDGALFHSTPYARDRDKIRQELLESRGWKIERIWSQDWSKDWRSEIARIDTVLKKLLSNW